MKRLKGLGDSVEKFTKATGIEHDITTRMKRAIISIDGDSDRANINKFVDTQFLAQDSRAFRTHLKDIAPDVDLSYNYVSLDGTETEVQVPMTVSFFWPSS